MERVRSELTQMNAEVKRVRQEKEKLAHEQRLQDERVRMLIRLEHDKVLYSHKVFNHSTLQLTSPPPYPQPHTHQPLQASKRQAVDEVLDLTLSPCSSPEPQKKHTNGSLSLNSFGVCKEELKIPETFHLEELISQEQQRDRRVPSQHNVHHNSLHTPQTIHTLKQQHTALSVLQQNVANTNAALALTSQNSAQYNSHPGLQGTDQKPDINTLTSHRMLIHQLQQRIHSVSRAPHAMRAAPGQKNASQNSLLHIHNPGIVPPSNHVPLSNRGLLPSHLDSKDSPDLQNDFRFDLDSIELPPSSYHFSRQASSSSSQSFSSPSLFSSELTSSSLPDSIGNAFPALSERPPLALANGHCSMDALDSHNGMTRGAPVDRSHTVIQYKPLDWDNT